MCEERIQLEERYRRGVQEEEEKRAGGKRLTSLKKKKLTILQWNADGISNKKSELTEVLSRYEADVAIFSRLYRKPHTSKVSRPSGRTEN